MRPYDQQDFWLHGTRFTLRCTPYRRPAEHRTNWRSRRPYAHNIGRFTLFCNGRFVGRFNQAKVRRWAAQIALKALNS